VRLPRAFDVVVSETVGNEAFDEGIVPLMLHARARFLRPGGALVPQAIALRAAPVAAPAPASLTSRLLRASSFASLAAHVPRGLEPAHLRPLAPSRELLRVDLRTVRPGAALPVARVGFRVSDARAVGGLAVWVVMDLAPGVRLSARTGTTWWPTFLPLDRLPAGPGRLALEVDWNPSRRRWAVDFVGDDGARRAAVHSPLFAWGAVRPALARLHLTRLR
jgi:hypothetical protein